MLYKLSNYLQRRWRPSAMRCLLVVWVLQGVHLHVPLHATEEARLPLVLLGSVTSGKNDTAAALLGAKFTWVDDFDVFLIVDDEEKARIAAKFGGPCPRPKRHLLSNTEEKTVFYDHDDLSYPFHNVRGFGKSGLFSVFSKEDVNTVAAHESLRKIIKQPIQGFVLHVDHVYLNRSAKKHRNLDAMDFLLPYFKDAAAVKKYLVPSVCLVITGFGGEMAIWDSTQQRKEQAKRSLCQLIKRCYTLFSQAKKGTEDYARLAKQKALYDTFLLDPFRIEPRGTSGFALNDFKLDLTKVVFFDPHTSVDFYRTEEADTTELEDALAMFQGIPAAALVSDGGGHAHWLWAVPVVGAAAYAWSGSRDSTKDDKPKKQPSGGSRRSMREDDDDIDDPMPEPPTSQAPQPPHRHVT